MGNNIRNLQVYHTVEKIKTMLKENYFQTLSMKLWKEKLKMLNYLTTLKDTKKRRSTYSKSVLMRGTVKW